jgi:hypothetical protein
MTMPVVVTCIFNLQFVGNGSTVSKWQIIPLLLSMFQNMFENGYRFQT